MKKSKKLSIIISSYFDLKNPVYSGGGARAVEEIAKRLARKYYVRVLTGTYKQAKNETIENVRYVRIGSAILGHKVGQLIFQYEVLRYAQKLDYDLWIESSTPPFTFSLLPLFCKKRVIVWINMLCSYDIKRKYFFNLRLIEQELCKLYRYAIAPTGWVKKELNSMNKKIKAVIIPQGYEQDILRKTNIKKPDFKDYLLYMGRIEVNQKGLDLLVKALVSTDDKTKVVIAGSGSEKEERKLDILISKYQVEDKVIRLGWVEGGRKVNLLRYAKAVVLPSRFETFSLTALEALVMGKPLICFNIPQLAWIPSKYAVKVTPFIIASFSRYMDTVVLWKKYKRMTAAQSQEFLDVFSWNTTARKFKEFIKETLV